MATWWRRFLPWAQGRFAAWRSGPGAIDTGACLLYLALAAWVGHGLWPDPATRTLANNVNDQTDRKSVV